MKRLFLMRCAITLIVLHAVGLQAESTLKDAEFIIEKERTNQLPTSARLFEKAPAPPQKATLGQKITYDLQEVSPTLDILPQKTKILRAKQDSLTKLYGNYVKAGLSSSLRPYLEGFFANKRSPQYAYGLGLRHLSIKHAPASREYYNDLQLHGKLFKTAIIGQGELHYSRNQYALYTAQGEEGEYQPCSETVHQLKLNPMLANVIPGPFNYQLGIAFNHLQYKGKQLLENQGKINLSADYALNDDFTLQGITALDLAQHTQDTTATKRLLWRISPTLSFLWHHCQIQGGFNVVYQNDPATVVPPLNVHPVLAIHYVRYPSFCPYIGFSGAVQQNALQDLVAENPLLAPNLALHPTNQSLVFYGGTRGKIVASVHGHIGFAVTKCQNFYCFVNSAEQPARFNVAYDPDATLYNVFGELLYTNRPETFKTRLRGDYFAYTLQQLRKPWHRPRYQLDILNTCRWYDKILFKQTLYWLGGIEAQHGHPENAKQLAGVIDLGFGIDYLWSQRLSIFISGHNLLARRNERYLHYPTSPFYCIGGMTYTW